MKSLFQLLPESECLASKLSLNLNIGHLTSDSRQVKPGSLYFAISGTKVDGHDFIPAALKNGAVAVVVENAHAFGQHPNTLHVRSSRRALALAANAFYDEPSRKFSLVGVTGTNGKTTTSYLLRAVWDKLQIRSGVLGTVEYHIGEETLPSSLTTPDPVELQRLFDRMVRANVETAVIEVSSIALDQERVSGTHFDIAIFTNLTQDHLDYHGTLEKYYSAKRRLFTDFALSHAVINIDDPYGARLAREIHGVELFSFSLQDPSAVFFVEKAQFEKQGTTAQVCFRNERMTLKTPLIGRHNLYNALGVFAAGKALGLNASSLIEALAEAQGAPGRLERVASHPKNPHVFVDYAHTPDALLNVLKALKALNEDGTSRMITVFGCGGDRDKTKRPLMAEIAASASDVTIVTSDNPRTESPEQILNDIEAGIRRGTTEYHREVDRKKAIRLALSLARPGDLVLVAGKGHETYQIIGKEYFPFDDRQVIREYYDHRQTT